jgi:two-component system sensor histidine kinase BaeS
MSDTLHDRPVWYRSLYWRIALGFIVCVAVVLLAQAALFLWLASRANPALARSPQELSVLAAAEFSAALESDATLNLSEHVTSKYGNSQHVLVLVMADGRLYKNRQVELPPVVLRMAQAHLARERGEAPRDPDPSERIDTPALRERSAAAPPQGGPRQGLRVPRRPPMGRVVVDGKLVGVTIAVPGPPVGNPFLAEYGPALTLAGIGLLLVGTATMAFFVFRPVRRRLRLLEDAAAAVGAGDSSARAPEAGGDEVAALARRFNRMAADLEARVNDLQLADRSRRQLLADVSHELMTPLTAMRGYLETLALPHAVADEATRERYLRIVTAETRRLEAIIGDLLDLARLESGGADLRRAAVAVSHLFARAGERHETVLREKDVTLESRVAPGAESVMGDERRLEQAVQNLVANAVRHTPRGGRVTLRAHRVDGRVSIVVSDTGAGIPPEHLDRIFDRFYRVDTARDQQSGGSGLGLSIVRAVVEQHGGTIAASNGPDGGARFEIRLEPGSGAS